MPLANLSICHNDLYKIFQQENSLKHSISGLLNILWTCLKTLTEWFILDISYDITHFWQDVRLVSWFPIQYHMLSLICLIRQIALKIVSFVTFCSFGVLEFSRFSFWNIFNFIAMQNIIGLLNVSFAPIIYIYENRSMFYIYKRLHMIQHLVVKFQSHSLCPKTEKWYVSRKQRYRRYILIMCLPVFWYIQCLESSFWNVKYSLFYVTIIILSSSFQECDCLL